MGASGSSWIGVEEEGEDGTGRGRLGGEVRQRRRGPTTATRWRGAREELRGIRRGEGLRTADGGSGAGAPRSSGVGGGRARERGSREEWGSGGATGWIGLGFREWEG